ncbi:MAG: hypothetical protein IT443_12655 [Phycisphaeraceae bacterium]|nr:hypothetical protein [Phycisphaeraceae bacterium]
MQPYSASEEESPLFAVQTQALHLGFVGYFAFVVQTQVPRGMRLSYLY